METEKQKMKQFLRVLTSPLPCTRLNLTARRRASNGTHPETVHKDTKAEANGRRSRAKAASPGGAAKARRKLDLSIDQAKAVSRRDKGKPVEAEPKQKDARRDGAAPRSGSSRDSRERSEARGDASRSASEGSPQRAGRSQSRSSDKSNEEMSPRNGRRSEGGDRRSASASEKRTSSHASDDSTARRRKDRLLYNKLIITLFTNV